MTSLTLDYHGSLRDYSLDTRADRKLRFIADRLAVTASKERCSYIDRILSGFSSRPRCTLNALRDILADVRYELDRAKEYEPKPATEAAFTQAWDEMERLVA